MARASDLTKHRCKYRIIPDVAKTTYTIQYTYLNPAERWCYEHVPADHLWYSETPKIPAWVGQPKEVAYWFEYKADAMHFKLVWC